MADTLQAQQLRMSRHIRDPQANPPPPGIEARRLAVYRQLFFGNLQSLLAGSFPVLHACLAPGEWMPGRSTRSVLGISPSKHRRRRHCCSRTEVRTCRCIFLAWRRWPMRCWNR
ncbi:hypothetical protein GCM10011247_14290 [Pseudomonas plecoglossicida]|nr:hypothetical protein L321_20102 [Pseudomonas plecoglossicida NB2011]GLR36032.1 hypothetical protein GCM10011247_14290 [Pseudomonas plecoglossicida]